MANTNDNDVDMTWASATSKVINAGASLTTSDTQAIHPDAVNAAAVVAFSAMTGATAYADAMDIYVAWSVDGVNFAFEEWVYRLSWNNASAAAVALSLPVSGKQAFRISTAPGAAISGNRTLTIKYNEHRMG